MEIDIRVMTPLDSEDGILVVSCSYFMMNF